MGILAEANLKTYNGKLSLKLFLKFTEGPAGKLQYFL